MMIALDWLLAALALIGHLAISVTVFNRLHGYPVPRKVRRVVEVVLILNFTIAIGWYAWHWSATGRGLAQNATLGFSLLILYPALCWLAVLILIPYWGWPRWCYRVPAQLVVNHTRKINVAAEVGPIAVHGTVSRFLSIIPGNEIFHLHVQEKTLELENLPPQLDGLTIAHLSDLHYTGELGRKYFEYVIDQANALDCDLAIVSGDIIESWSCQSWLQPTLGRLQARLGKYFVLGNHDRRMRDEPRVRQLISDCGLIDLGKRSLLVDLRGVPVLLTGNERPWFDGPDESEVQALGNQAKFRLLVAHAPDLIRWASRREFDLMLAGHNHGGQICFPLVGPLISPSLSGTLYSGGLYYRSPTLLHVSRGLSGEHLYRCGAPPELAKLVLRSRDKS